MSARRARQYPRQDGVALITVILLVALLTAIVSRLSFSNEIWLRQVQNSSALAQARQATQAAQLWVISILQQDNNNFDGATDTWAQPVLPIPIAWGEMYGWLEDLQGRFNINNLVDEEGKANLAALHQFQSLLGALGLDPNLSQAVIDWIDPDGNTYDVYGAEDLYYLGLRDPYMTANRPMLDINELRQVRGIDEQAWNSLQPHITALPAQTAVNINSATAEVLAAAMADSDKNTSYPLDEVQVWVQQAQSEPFVSLDAFMERTDVVIPQVSRAGLDVRSSFFRAQTQVSFANVEHRMITFYQRQAGRVRILHQSRALF